MITIADLIKYRMHNESMVREVAKARLPTEFGEFEVHAFENQLDKQTHVALVFGAVGDGQNIMVRVHSQCLTGDVLHSMRCDCGGQLETAMQRISDEGRGCAVFELRTRHRPREQDPRYELQYQDWIRSRQTRNWLQADQVTTASAFRSSDSACAR